MARTVKAPDVRRSELITTAQELFYTKGYESTSITDIVKSVGVAKGTFYYYFDSKQAILETLVDELVTQVVAILQEIVADETLTAIPKWTQAFQIIGNWKLEQKADLMAMARVMQQADNVLLLHKMQTQSVQMVPPELAKIIAQGVDEGVFTTTFVEESAELSLSIVQAFSNAFTNILLYPDNYDDPVALAERKLAAAEAAIERVLGAPSGSLPLIDTKSFAAWFEY
jgi:AcrR family transcriptional regulator